MLNFAAVAGAVTMSTVFVIFFFKFLINIYYYYPGNIS